MAKINIAIRDDLEDWARSQIAGGAFTSTDELVNALLDRARDDARKLAWLQAEVNKGIASGIDPRPVKQIFEDLRARHGLGQGA